ncbi:MAG: energy-coupling factor ABC transporter substrate-binding protein [Methanomassiliicoccus sp.]|nr:energy-coupling factor ABC transporter substrate-binding protein [Methanomassiliicoccus sp.]
MATKIDHRIWYVVGFSIIIVICLAAFIVAPGGDFGGSDGQGEKEINNIDPNYKPWFESLWTPPGETESLLFALQAAIGALIIGLFIGNERGKRAARKAIGKEDHVTAGEGAADK